MLYFFHFSLLPLSRLYHRKKNETLDITRRIYIIQRRQVKAGQSPPKVPNLTFLVQLVLETLLFVNAGGRNCNNTYPLPLTFSLSLSLHAGGGGASDHSIHNPLLRYVSPPPFASTIIKTHNFVLIVQAIQ